MLLSKQLKAQPFQNHYISIRIRERHVLKLNTLRLRHITHRQIHRPRHFAKLTKSRQVLKILMIVRQLARNMRKLPRHHLRQPERRRYKSHKHSDTYLTRTKRCNKHPRDQNRNKHSYKACAFHFHETVTLRHKINLISRQVFFVITFIKIPRIPEQRPFLHIVPPRQNPLQISGAASMLRRFL